MSNISEPEISMPSISESNNNGIFDWLNSIPIWVILLVIVGLAIYFMPSIINYLSLSEEVVEEEVKKEIDEKRDIKVLEDVEEIKELEDRGYCYIGTDRGIRSCIDVKPGDRCMSGKIFPRRDICVNPSLRL
jgi:hypothetical protein